MVFLFKDVLVERFKNSFQISKSNWVFGKDVASKFSLRYPQLEYTRFPRAANEPPRATLCGVSSRPLGLGLCTARPIENHCDYSPHRKHFLPQESRVFQLLGRVFILNELLYYSNSSNHNIYMILLFVNSKRYLVDWNGRRRLLENTNRFSSCEVMLPKLSLSCGNSKRSSVGRTIVQSHES